MVNVVEHVMNALHVNLQDVMASEVLLHPVILEAPKEVMEVQAVQAEEVLEGGTLIVVLLGT